MCRETFGKMLLPPQQSCRQSLPSGSRCAQLVDFVLKRLASAIAKRRPSQFRLEALSVLTRYNWPGNVREAEILIYRSAVMSQGDTILIKDLPQEVVTAVGLEPPSVAPKAVSPEATGGAAAHQEETVAAASPGPAEPPLLGEPAGDPFEAVYAQLRREKATNILEHAERELIARALREVDGKQIKAAEILGMTRATLRKRIDQYGLTV
jgi:Response regulator containing CheY-like receiver, AAA-type ATPase, and DNA-binding domains